jgi:hypothetical protein
MLTMFARVAMATGADVLTDLSDNFVDDLVSGTRRFSHRSVAVGPALAHNFFVNNFGKANFCVRPARALAAGAHHEEASPFVDWGFLARAGLAGLSLQLVPLPLYAYSVNSSGSIFYSAMASPQDRYRGHAKMLADVHAVVPAELRDAVTLCKFRLGVPHVAGGGN